MRTASKDQVILPRQRIVVGIRRSISEDFLAAVVTQAVKFHDSASSGVKKLADRVVKENIQIPGFRDASKAWRAPDGTRILLQHLISTAARSNPVFEALLALWEEANHDLGISITNLLLEHGIPVRDGLLSDEISGEWDRDQVYDNLDEFVVAHPRFSTDEARLMVHCKCASFITAPSNETPAVTVEGSHKQTTGPYPEVLERIFVELGSLSPNALEWDHIELFISDLRSLAHGKIQERDIERDALKQLISTLSVDASVDITSGKTLSFFGLDASHWRADACPISDVCTVREMVTKLSDVLDMHGDVVRRPFTDASSRREKHQELDRLEALIRECFDTVNSMLDDPSDGDSAEDSGSDRATLEVPTTGESTAAIIETPDEPETASDLAREDVVDPTIQLNITEPIPLQVDTLGDTSTIADNNVLEVDPPSTLASDTNTSMLDPVPDAVDLIAVTVSDTEVIRTVEEVNSAIAQPDTNELPDVSNSPSLSEVWELVTSGDYAGAYLLASSAESQNVTCPIPSALLAALQGAMWLTFDTQMIRDDVLSIATSYVPEGTADIKRIGLAAVLLPAILSHNNQFSGWLASIKEYGSVGIVQEAVQEFALGNQALRAMDCTGGNSPVVRKEALKDLSGRAEHWLADARSNSFDIFQARKIWERLVRPDSELIKIMRAVAENRRSEEPAIRALLTKLERREDVQRLIGDIGRSLHRGKDMILAGERRDAMVRDVQAAVSIGRSWSALTQEDDGSHVADWFSRLSSSLLDQLRKSIPKVLTELEAQSSDDDTIEHRAATRCLKQSVEHVATVLGIELPVSCGDADAVLPPADWWIYEPATQREEPLARSLNRRLLWLPELDIVRDDSTGALPIPTLNSLCKPLLDRPPTLLELEVALEGWRSREDFRYEVQICSAFADDERTHTLLTDGNALRDKAVANLQRKKEDVALENERALRDGVLLDEEYTANDADLISAILESSNCRRSKMRIEAVAERVSEARKCRSLVQHETWTDIQTRLSPHVSTDVWESIRGRVEDRISHHDVQVTDFYIAELRECLDINQPPDASWVEANMGAVDSTQFKYQSAQSALDDYVRIANQVTDALRKDIPRSLRELEFSLNDQKNWNGLEFKAVPKVRLKEAASAVSEWKSLKEKRPTSIEDSDLHSLRVVLSYLGFGFNRANDPMRIRASDRDWLHVTAHMSVAADSVRSIPQFGSAGVRDGFHIVCFWDRLEAVGISARLDTLRLNSDSVIILYLGSLTLQQRIAFTEMARKRKACFAILDESLLAYLALQRDTRLRAFLECSLPFSAPNPYTPDRAGSVPQEMFFGRDDMVDRLTDPNGSCIVYGGRQLGKSALLVATQRKFHDPEQNRYAWIEDIRLTGTSAICISQPTSIIKKLLDRFVEHGLLVLGKSVAPDALLSHIKGVFQKNKDLRVLVMLDEADNFLDADAISNFPIVSALRQLMDETNRRFKVIFAGLHHVQRFRHYSNQPLSHFGAPILVGPLAPQHATVLVREPLQCLGYRVTDAEVMRVLSHTNRHPGLIQKYCFELLRKLHNSVRREVPTIISQNIVEAVYLDPEVRSLIATRFEDTLNLDDRYRMIAYAVTVEQMSERDSYAKVFYDHQILDMVKWYASPLFSTTNSDGMRFLLEEMCGLGVLIHVFEQGGYRLRSPNLVRLLGTEQTISQRLLELASKPVDSMTETESLHAPITPTLRSYSALTRGQEIGLNVDMSGVGLLFASRGQGLASLPDALSAFLSHDLGPRQTRKSYFEEMPGKYTGESEVKQWLATLAQNERSAYRLSVYQMVTQRTGLDKRVRAAVQFCRDFSARSNSESSIQVYFLFDDDSTAGWLSMPEADRQQLENSAMASTWPRPWSLYAIRQRLIQLDLDVDSAETIFEATGGWQYLLDMVFKGTRGEPPLEVARRILSEQMGEGPITAEFKRKIALREHTPEWNVWSFIHNWQTKDGLPINDIEVDRLTTQECEMSQVWLERMGCIERHVVPNNTRVSSDPTCADNSAVDLIRTDAFLSRLFANEVV